MARVAAENQASSLNLIPLHPDGRSVHQMMHDVFSQESTLIQLLAEEMNAIGEWIGREQAQEAEHKR